MKKFTYLIAVSLLATTSSQAMVSDFEDVAQGWANKIAKKYNTSVSWVKIDGSDNQGEGKVTSQYLGTETGVPQSIPQLESDIIFTQRFNNNNSTPSPTVFKRTVQDTDTFTWQITEGLKITEKGSAQITTDFIIAGATLTIESSQEINFSATQTTTTTTAKTWEVDETFTTAPYKATDFSAVLQKAVFNDIPFTSKLQLNGKIAVWFEDKINLRNINDPKDEDKHFEWFVPVTEVIAENPTPGYFLRDNAVIYKVKGFVSGTAGVRVEANVTEVPLES